MPLTSRITDFGSGHGCFPPSPAISASPKTYINGLKALRQGDAVAPHGCPKCPPHGRSVSGGSPSVYVDGKPLARKGDGISCGGSMSGSSSDVYADELTPRPVYAVNKCARDCMKRAKQGKQAFVG